MNAGRLFSADAIAVATLRPSAGEPERSASARCASPSSADACCRASAPTESGSGITAESALPMPVPGHTLSWPAIARQSGEGTMTGRSGSGAVSFSTASRPLLTAGPFKIAGNTLPDGDATRSSAETSSPSVGREPPSGVCTCAITRPKSGLSSTAAASATARISTRAMRSSPPSHTSRSSPGAGARRQSSSA